MKHKQFGLSLTEENYDYTTQSTDTLCAQKNESNFILVRMKQHCLNKLPSISTIDHQQMSRTFHVSQFMLFSSRNSKEKCFSASPSYIKRLPVKLLRGSKPRNHSSSERQPMPEPSKESLNILHVLMQALVSRRKISFSPWSRSENVRSRKGN